MSMWNSIVRLFNGTGVSNPDHGYQLGAFEKTSTNAGVRVTDEQSLKVSAVWLFVKIL